jgi:hypothetical protein
VVDSSQKCRIGVLDQWRHSFIIPKSLFSPSFLDSGTGLAGWSERGQGQETWFIVSHTTFSKIFGCIEARYFRGSGRIQTCQEGLGGDGIIQFIMRDS